MSVLVSTGLVEPAVRYCCLCMVVFSNLVTFAMPENIEQRYAIKFCVKLNKSATETFDSLTEAYGDATLSRTMFFQVAQSFQRGPRKCWRRPSFWKTNLVNKWSKCGSGVSCDGKDRRLSVRMIAEEAGLNKNSVHRILTEYLHMRKICAKLVPKNLSVEQKANRLEICQDLLGKTRN